MRVVGWNIFTEEENEKGEIELIHWNISDGLARAIEQEFAELLEYLTSDDEE
tara:strand:- start:3479 stop:3634 length:156 start_codon:yes stop_codon:yes gene_type:complete